MGEALVSGGLIPEVGNKRKLVVVGSDPEEEVASDGEMASVIEVGGLPESPQLTYQVRSDGKKTSVLIDRSILYRMVFCFCH